MDPLVFGDYPFSMRAYVGNRLPKFTEEQSKLVQGSFDFIGLNYYTSNYARNIPFSNMVNVSYNTDAHVAQTGIFITITIIIILISYTDLIFN